MTLAAHGQVRAELTSLLGFARDAFPTEQTKHVEDFIAADEYQLALEWILDGMAELHVPLPPAATALVRTLASRLGIQGAIAPRLARLRVE